MKKSILITAAAFAVVLAVVLTAGCVGDNAQQQTTDKSIWMYTDDAGTIVRYISLSNDGAGLYAEYKAETAENGEEEYKIGTEQTFTWTKDADGKIRILSENDGEKVLTMDENKGILTSLSGKVYQQIPSELSGARIGLTIPNSLYYADTFTEFIQLCEKYVLFTDTN